MNIDNMKLDEICEELDSLTLRMLQLMKEYINVKLIIEGLIKDGCLHLAKSRYIMGNRSVSALQLPTEDSSDIIASTTIICKEANDPGDALSLELSRLNLNDNAKGSENESLRLRGKHKKEEMSDSTKTSSSVQDPLKWFGVLVPHDMRQAQLNFNKAIDYTIQCANIQLEIVSVEEKYKKYVNKKQELIKEQ